MLTVIALLFKWRVLYNKHYFIGQILIDTSKYHILIKVYTMSYLIIIVVSRDAYK